MIYKALIKIFGDRKRAWRALGLLVGLMENHSNDYDDWDEGYEEIYLILLDSLQKEFRG